MEGTKAEAQALEPDDSSLITSFAAGQRLDENLTGGAHSTDTYIRQMAAHEMDGRLIDAADFDEFLATVSQTFAGFEQREVLRRALSFIIPTSGETIELSFLSLFSSLESTLTFFRRQDEYHILPREEFSQLERELKGWLKQHPLLAGESQKRAMIYEKLRELNRLPFTTVFKKFCERYDLNLKDLWPLIGPLKEWPLLEVRHRLVHGDPFMNRPAEALLCAREHLRWTAQRMLLSVFNWPVERSNVSPEHLAQTSEMYRRWPEERARFA